MEQSVEWYHALSTMKVPIQLVVYPNEGHVFVKPADFRDYFVRTLDWFDQWFAKVGNEQPCGMRGRVFAFGDPSEGVL